MDIVNFISTEGYASLLSKLLMKPYQLSMTSYLRTTNQSLSSKAEAISMQQAIKTLKVKQSDLETTELEDKINTRLTKTILN